MEYFAKDWIRSSWMRYDDNDYHNALFLLVFVAHFSEFRDDLENKSTGKLDLFLADGSQTCGRLLSARTKGHQ